MSGKRSIRKLFALLCLGLVLPALTAAAEPPRPNSSLSPADVVRIQLQALRHNDRPKPDAGIATVYAFASPGNHSVTGSLAGFAQLIHNGYQPMIGNRKIILGKARIKSGQAFLPVQVIAGNGRLYSYLFILSRQKQTPCRNCWMTDSVLSRDRGRGAGLSI